MFEQALLEGSGKTNKGWTIFVSSGMQVGLVATLCVVPLLSTDLLPRTTLQMMMVAPVPPPPPAPPASPAAQMQKTRPVARRQFDGVHLSEPVRIPEKVALLASDELPPMVGNEIGVPGNIESGIPGGVRSIAPQLAQMQLIPPPAAKTAEHVVPITRVVMGGVVLAARLVHKVIPLYPQLARQARISGTVQFTAIIARDGTIQNLTLISGHALLVQAATDAVRQWRYRPTLLNGEPVEVISPIDVIFVLNQ